MNKVKVFLGIGLVFVTSACQMCPKTHQSHKKETSTTTHLEEPKIDIVEIKHEPSHFSYWLNGKLIGSQSALISTLQSQKATRIKLKTEYMISEKGEEKLISKFKRARIKVQDFEMESSSLRLKKSVKQPSSQ